MGEVIDNSIQIEFFSFPEMFILRGILFTVLMDLGGGREELGAISMPNRALTDSGDRFS